MTAHSSVHKCRTVKVKVAVEADELRRWAAWHADAGHAGVAHVLYLAAEGVESVTEQALREAREERVPEPLPVVAHKADGETDVDHYRAMTIRLMRGYAVGGSADRYALVVLIRREIARAEGATP